MLNAAILIELSENEANQFGLVKDKNFIVFGNYFISVVHFNLFSSDGAQEVQNPFVRPFVRSWS